MRTLTRIAGITFIALAAGGCANRGIGPQGGPKDTTPPAVIRTVPAERATRVGLTGTVITLETDENISVKDPSKVVVSPPQKTRATVKGTAKRVTVTFADTLKENTTYTVQFGDNIVDYTEGNPLKGYEFVFSTGDTVDSLQVAGSVLDSRTLAPMEGLTVGLHGDLGDSAVYRQPFDYITTTDAQGQFRLTGVREGAYRIYALNDAAGTCMYTQTGTDIAFHDSVIYPEVHVHATVDTLWSDSARTVWDSLDVHTYPKYLPEGLLLLSFREETPRQFFRKGYRPKRGELDLVFNQALAGEPELRLLDDSAHTEWVTRGRSDRQDSCVYWLKDTALLRQDTLRLTVTYPAFTDNGADTLRADTLTLLYRAPAAKRKSDSPAPETRDLTIQHNLSAPLEIGDTVRLRFAEPVTPASDTALHLALQQDTLWIPVPFTWSLDNPECATEARVIFDRTWGATYRLRVDSLAFTSHYGGGTLPVSKTFQVKRPEDYSNLYILTETEFTDGVLELMNDKEEVLRAEAATGETAFENLTPGTYMLRMYRDLNGNGRWDTGSLSAHRHAEPVYYLPKKLQLRANWDNEETWNPLSVEREKQRPPSENAAAKSKIR